MLEFLIGDSHRLPVTVTDPNLSQRALSCNLGISLGKVNYCLKVLIAKGWIKVKNFEQSSNQTPIFSGAKESRAETKCNLIFSLSKPVDVVDMADNSKFIRMINREGVTLYG